VTQVVIANVVNLTFLCIFVSYTCLCYQPLDDAQDPILPTDTDRRYFYKCPSANPERFIFESAFHKDHYLSVSKGEVILKKSINPENDIDLHFQLYTALLPT
jgi:hypothetical protein